MVLVLFFAFLLFGCTLERDNPYDPNGTNYNPSLYPSSSSLAPNSSSSFSSSSLPDSLVPCKHDAGCAEISAETCFAFGGQMVASCPASSSSLSATVSSSGGVSDGSSSSSGEGGSSSSLPPVMVLCALSDGTCPLTLIPQEACVTFGGTPVPSCVGSSSSALPSSSSVAPSSSSVVQSSSSSATFSSSSIALSSSSSVPIFACTMAATTGTVGMAITPVPVATCNGSTVTAGLAWTPANLTPATTGSVLVSVSASSGVCSGMAVQCGSVTVPTLACTMAATTGMVGMTITPAPAVTCNGSTVTAGFAWTPANLIPTTTGSVPVSVSASSGVCSGMAVGCGSVTVTVYSGKGNNISSYKTVRIGDQTWMAENLNYVVEGSKCNSNSSANCDKYGSLYNWATAMALPASCNSNSCSSQVQSPHQGICSAGWHLPSYDEWTTLREYVGSFTAGTKLKATSGWDYNGVSGNGTDEYGFSALPGSGGRSDGSFFSVGSSGVWWSATESKYDASTAYGASMHYDDSYFGTFDNSKSWLYSVRCVQD